MSFFDLSALRAILTTETDADSPINEELMSQIRENLEAILILLASTGITGSATSDPPNDTTGYLTDTASSWSNDDHNGRTLLLTSGLAKGNMYTIDDTDDANNRLVCTGDNLYADGVRSGDTYLILYDVKNNADGHDHDGINSSNVVLADDSVANVKLKSVANTTGASGSLNAESGVNVVMQDYCFFPNTYTSRNYEILITCHNTNTADTTARLGLWNSDQSLSTNYAVRWRYITASDEPFIYALRDKITGEIIHLWACDDPPPGYWGMKEKPDDFVPPITGNFNLADMDEIVLFNQNKNFVIELGEKARKDKKLPFEILSKGYDFDHKKKLFLSKNLKEI